MVIEPILLQDMGRAIYRDPDSQPKVSNLAERARSPAKDFKQCSHVGSWVPRHPRRDTPTNYYNDAVGFIFLGGGGMGGGIWYAGAAGWARQARSNLCLPDLRRSSLGGLPFEQ